MKRRKVAEEDLLSKEEIRAVDRARQADMVMADTEVVVISVLPDRRVYPSSAIPVVVVVLLVARAEAIAGPIPVMRLVR